MENADLKECVCKAGISEIARRIDGTEYTAFECRDCGLRSPMASTKALAINLWNGVVRAINYMASR